MMHTSTLVCKNDKRRERVRKANLNGLDYVEVRDDQPILEVYFLGRAPQNLTKENFVIEGGQRRQDVRIKSLEVHYRDPKSTQDDWVTLKLNQDGDFSTYTLRLVNVPEVDPFYDHLDFSFHPDCPSDLDCKTADICPSEVRLEPELNYLAKDYASFRQLILDRLALIMPDWRERHIPDLGIALVELLAYVGDHLSYYQDAVATEAYLDTARQRISVRRHARLVDYFMHEGCNARAWVCIETDSDLTGDNALDPRKVYFVTGNDDEPLMIGTVLAAEILQQVSPDQYEVFEPMGTESISLFAAHSEIHFYTWDESECCLPRGATRATLLYDWTQFVPMTEGSVLIFEEVYGPKTGRPEDAEPTHRHAVRLTKVTAGEDRLNSQPILEIEWSKEDALPFPLCISGMTDAEHGCKSIENISVARGNVILVDHGRTQAPEDLDIVPCLSTQAECECADHLTEITFLPGRFRPQLSKTSLTHSVPFPPPGAIASSQARFLSTIMSKVEDRVRSLWQKANGGEVLSPDEIRELQNVFGREAMKEAEKPEHGGKAWPEMDHTQQAAAIKQLLAEKDKWLTYKARRLAILQARARSGQQLHDAISEITGLFGERYTDGLRPGSPTMLGPAGVALQQDPRQALPQIAELKSIPPMPATDCKDLGPFFRLADLLDPASLVSTLRDVSDPVAQILRTRLSSRTIDLLDQSPDDATISNELKEALTEDLKQMLLSWSVQSDLLSSGAGDRHFVVEVDNDGLGTLRFGDGDLGAQPEAGSSFFAKYRIGNGMRGNVAAEAISHVVFRDTTISRIRLHVRNPLSAHGGTEPESIADVKLFAPSAFRKELQRGITAGDYSQFVRRDFTDQVQGAGGALTWTGSWYETQVVVDPFGSAEVPSVLLDAIQDGLYRYRRMGRDLAVGPARYVPLDIALDVCLKHGYLGGHVKAALLDVFSDRILPDGKLGFFHPDRLTFGEGIYLSQIVSAAQAVEGVESVQVTRLQRRFERANQELENGVLPLDALEVARCDNDANIPENGRIEINIANGVKHGKFK